LKIVLFNEEHDNSIEIEFYTDGSKDGHKVGTTDFEKDFLIMYLYILQKVTTNEPAFSYKIMQKHNGQHIALFKLHFMCNYTLKVIVERQIII
jgi:hypothetical protein